MARRAHEQDRDVALEGFENRTPVHAERAADLITRLILSSKLRQYRDVVEPKSGKAKLVFINLQKRLLFRNGNSWKFGG